MTPAAIARVPPERLVDAAKVRDRATRRQAWPMWDRAAEMILVAAETRKRGDVAEATRQVLVALEKENWLK